VLRRARAEDAASVAAVFRASYRTLTFLPILHTPEEDRVYFTKVVGDDEVWVYEDGGQLVGFAALTPELLSHLYIHPERIGEGIGTVLLDKAKERRPEGFRFWVFQRNERARRFYERHGCQLVELSDGSGNEEKEPDALYEWVP
jgi:putative acetyltransferase